METLEKQQGLALKTRFSSPSAIFSSVFSMFANKSGTEGINEAGFFKQDFLGLISRFVIPFALNKTIFRHSNFLIKTLVGVLSQKASHYVNEDSIGGLVHKLKGLFNNDGPAKSGGIVGSVKSIFAVRRAKKAVNYPTHVPTVQNVLKSDL